MQGVLIGISDRELDVNSVQARSSFRFTPIARYFSHNLVQL